MTEDFPYLLERMLFQVLGDELKVEDILMQSGGSINMAVCAKTEHGNFFVKWNEFQYLDMFEKEAKSLKLLKGKSTLRIPEVFGYGQVEEKAFLVLEFLEQGLESPQYWKKLGEGLAQLHGDMADAHGLPFDNYMGQLVQVNKQEANWVTFYVVRRLKPQVGKMTYEGLVTSGFQERFNAFLEKLPEILPPSKPCLLHGDLWNGNVFPTGNEATVFDPAIYYGAPEMDLAMTELFGGFAQAFYEAYEHHHPIMEQYKEHKDLYQLYPLLVHANIFGVHSGYLSAVDRIIKRYL